MAKATAEKVVKKGKAVEKVDTSIPEGVATPTPKTIQGKQIVKADLLASGHYHVVDTEGTVYTLPATEYAVL
jgi:hypothetical protein